MANQSGEYVYSTSLVDRNGIWTLRGKYEDPITHETRYLSKSTGYKVKNHSKRKAMDMVPSIVDNWNAEIANEFAKTQSGLSAEPTFSEYVELYLKSKELDGTASSSLVTYERVARTVLGEQFGDLAIKDLKKTDIQDFFVEQKKHLSIDTLKLQLTVIKAILELAVDDDVIPKNPAKYVKVGESETVKEKGVFTADQLKTFLNYVKNYGEPYLSVVVLGGLYALRRGEILGLRWKDVDFESKTISIQHTVTQVNGKLIELDKTKTKSSKRTLYMMESTVDYFKALKQSQIDAGFELDKVCRYPNGNTVKPATISKYVPRFMKQAGVPVIRLHDLRATALTLLSKAKGVSIKEVADFAGHSKPDVTFGHYIRVAREDRVQVSKAFNEFITSSMNESAFESAV